ncbi:MAG: hypothetical protein N2442_01620 [Spirochaetes bacterium]|nr:hypothetical protein [Spirochaetota bacterium]
MVYGALFLVAVFLAYLVLSLLGGKTFWFYKSQNLRNEKSYLSSSTKVYSCPICGHLLQKGQRVKSIVFHGGTESGTVKEQVSHLLGCPYCYPPNHENPRKCPVCGATLPKEGYLIARFFTRKGNRRKHVHVLGCTECRKQRRLPYLDNRRA